MSQHWPDIKSRVMGVFEISIIKIYRVCGLCLWNSRHGPLMDSPGRWGNGFSRSISLLNFFLTGTSELLWNWELGNFGTWELTLGCPLFDAHNDQSYRWNVVKHKPFKGNIVKTQMFALSVIHQPNVGSMLVHRLRCWHNIGPALGWCRPIVFAGIYTWCVW